MPMDETELVRTLKRRISKFMVWRDKEINEEENRRFAEYYASRFWRKGTNAPRGGVPLVFSFVDVKMSALDGRIGEFEAVSRELFKERVNRAEALLNYETFHLDWRREWQKAHLAAHLTDYGGWLKMGWDSLHGVTSPDTNEVEGRVADTDGKQVEHDVNVRFDHPWVKSMSGKDVAFDTSASELTDAAWVAMRYRRTVGDLIRDPRTRRGSTVKLSASFGGREAQSHEEIVDLWEIWDSRERKVYHLCMRINELIYDPVGWPFDLNGYPLVHLKFFDAYDYESERVRPIFGMASVRSWFSLVEQRNHFRTNALIASDRLVPKYYGERGTFDGNGAQVFESRIHAAFVTVAAGKRIEPLATPSVRPDDRMTDMQVMDDFRFASGVAEQQAGVGMSGSDTTATEIIERSKFSGSRTNQMADKYDDFLSQMARKVMILLKLFWPSERSFPIIDSLHSGGVTGFTDFPDEWKTAEYDIVRLKPESARPHNRATERQQAIQIGTTLSQLAPALMQAELMSRQTYGEATFSAMGFLRWFMGKFDREIPKSAMEDMFPTMDQQDPKQENVAMYAGGDAMVLPEDNDQRHIRSHVRFVSLYQQGEWGEPNPEVIEIARAHITEHLAGLAVEQGLVKFGQNLQQQQQPQQPQQPQSGGGNLMPGQGNIESVPGPAMPNDANAFAQPEQGGLQAI